MGLNAESRARFNLKNANVLLVEAGSMGMEILVQILVGFGARNLHRCDKISDAKDSIGKQEFDLMIVGAALADGDGYELVEWTRREAKEPNKFAPILMVSGHTAASMVIKARDCGAHFIIAKPLTPIVLLERIIWVAREQRPFVEDAIYTGPDRRFKFNGPPSGSTGRRRNDLSGKVGASKEPNMSQDQIDALLQPQKVLL